MKGFTFNLKFALSKLLIFLTSTKNLVLTAGVLFAVFSMELTPEIEAVIVGGATFLAAILKAWEDNHSH